MKMQTLTTTTKKYSLNIKQSVNIISTDKEKTKMEKLYERVMNGASVSEPTMNKLCDWLDSNINDGFLTEDDDKVELYEKMKKDLNDCVGYLWR